MKHTILCGCVGLVIGLVTVAQTPAHADSWRSPFLNEQDGSDILSMIVQMGVFITVDDLVKGGCWTNVEATENAIELSLRRSGIRVQEFGNTPIILTFSVLGEPRGDSGLSFGCVSTYRMTLSWVVPSSMIVDSYSGSYDMLVLETWGYAASAGGETLNDLLRTQATELSDALALRMLRAQ